MSNRRDKADAAIHWLSSRKVWQPAETPRPSPRASSTGQNARRERLRRYLRDKGFGCLQNSVWITPDPLAEERQVLGGGKIDVESLLLLEAVTNDPRLPGRILPADYLGQQAGRRPIPKGLRPPAQGCEERATLGHDSKMNSTATRLRQVLSRRPNQSQTYFSSHSISCRFNNARNSSWKPTLR